MTEVINLPFDGRDIVIKESIDSLDRSDEVNGYIRGKYVLWFLDTSLPSHRLIEQDLDGNLIFEATPEILQNDNLPDSKMNEIATVTGTLEVEGSHFQPGMKYSIGAKLFARTVPGTSWELDHRVDTWIDPPRHTWEWDPVKITAISGFTIYCMKLGSWGYHTNSPGRGVPTGSFEIDAYAELSTEPVAFADTCSGEKIVVVFGISGKKIIFDKLVLSIKEYTN